MASTRRIGTTVKAIPCGAALLGLLAAAGCEDRELIVGGWSVRPVDKPVVPAAPRDGGGPVTAGTPVPGCTQWKTMGEMDGFFASRCGDGAVCHARAGVFGDYASPNFFERVTKIDGTVTCRGSKLADPDDWRKSLLWLKAFDAPRCPNGWVAGVIMPSPPAPRLDPTELACLEGFLKVLSGGK